MHKTRGFTLLEILIALFIFTIVSTILAAALHNIMQTQAATERNAERLRALQMTLLVMSRDIEQGVDRPVISMQGREEQAFVGSPQSFSFTHLGPLQRVTYVWHDNALYRETWEAVDQTAQTKKYSRRWLTNVSAVHFQYLDKDAHFNERWPIADKTDQALPKAVQVSLTLAQWGEIKQLYVIPVQIKK